MVVERLKFKILVLDLFNNVKWSRDAGSDG
jgi:hypothetical protein